MPFGFKTEYAGNLTADSVTTDGASVAPLAGTTGQVQFTDGAGLPVTVANTSLHYTDANGGQFEIGQEDEEFTLNGKVSLTGDGSAISIVSGSGASSGGTLTLRAGGGILGGEGGDTVIYGGNGAAGGGGGPVQIISGSGGASGDDAGDISITAANGGTTSDGGTVSISTGSGGSTSGNSGDLLISTGTTSGSGTGGTVLISAGTSIGGVDGGIRFVQGGTTYIWPTVAPTTGQVLSANVSGNTATLSWIAN